MSLVAAGCAFYATLALFPTITMLISLYGLVYNPDTVQPQLHYLRSFMPPAAFSLISDRIHDLVATPARGLGISFVISLADFALVILHGYEIGAQCVDAGL